MNLLLLTCIENDFGLNTTIPGSFIKKNYILLPKKKTN